MLEGIALEAELEPSRPPASIKSARGFEADIDAIKDVLGSTRNRSRPLTTPEGVQSLTEQLSSLDTVSQFGPARRIPSRDTGAFTD